MIVTGEQLTGFLQRARYYNSFHQSHFSLYEAKLMCYQNALCQNPFRITRLMLMKHSGLHSFATYHKCMRNLVLYGFVDYQPSYHPYLASQLSLLIDSNRA